jgi:hypothetical protein
MDVLYVLIPLSVVLVFFVLGALGGPFTGASSRMWNASAFSRTIDARQRVHDAIEDTAARLIRGTIDMTFANAKRRSTTTRSCGSSPS